MVHYELPTSQTFQVAQVTEKPESSLSFACASLTNPLLLQLGTMQL